MIELPGQEGEGRDGSWMPERDRRDSQNLSQHGGEEAEKIRPEHRVRSDRRPHTPPDLDDSEEVLSGADWMSEDWGLEEPRWTDSGVVHQLAPWPSGRYNEVRVHLDLKEFLINTVRSRMGRTQAEHVPAACRSELEQRTADFIRHAEEKGVIDLGLPTIVTFGSVDGGHYLPESLDSSDGRAVMRRTPEGFVPEDTSGFRMNVFAQAFRKPIYVEFLPPKKDFKGACVKLEIAQATDSNQAED